MKNFFLVLGVLGVLLLTTSVTNPNYFYDPKYQTLPYYEWFYKIYQPQNIVFAQDEDEEEEDSKDKDEEDKEDEEGDSKDEEESDAEENETIATFAEPLEQLSDEYLDVTKTKEELDQQAAELLTEEQQVKEQLNNILVENNWTNPNKPIINLSGDQILNNPIPNTTELDPSCNCTNPPIEPPNENVMPPTVTPPPQGLQQIIIKPSDIQNVYSWGDIKDPAYTNFYAAKNVVDNKIDDYSFWSQYGKSGFIIELNPESLSNYEVCSAEMVIHNPKAVQTTLSIGMPIKNYTGIINATTEKVEFDSCVRDVSKIAMSFDAPQKYSSVAEVKLFGKSLIPTQQPTEPSGNNTKILIKDSNAEISIIDSNVTFKFDPQSAQATNYNVITIPTMEGAKK